MKINYEKLKGLVEEKKTSYREKKMQMMANGGRVEYEDYRGRLRVMGVKDDNLIKTVLKDTGHGVTTVGFGSNKKRWIVEVEDN